MMIPIEREDMLFFFDASYGGMRVTTFDVVLEERSDVEVCGDSTIPINAISNVSRDNQVLLTSTLEHIQEDINTNPLEMPVVFLIGVKPI